jgi:hypothetical protein
MTPSCPDEVNRFSDVPKNGWKFLKKSAASSIFSHGEYRSPISRYWMCPMDRGSFRADAIFRSVNGTSRISAVHADVNAF